MYSLNIPFKSLSAALVLASATSQAAVVLNPSFELDGVADNSFLGSALNWTVSGGAGGAQDYPVGLTPQATNLEQHGYANGGATLSQLTSETFVGGQTYTLTVDVGQLGPNFSGSLATLRLFGTAGPGTAVAELINIGPASGAYLFNQTFTYSAPIGGAFEGQTVGIALIGQAGGAQVLFDNVRFDVAQVPETSSLLLGGLGALAILRRRRI